MFANAVQSVTVSGLSGSGKTLAYYDAWELPVAGNLLLVVTASAVGTAEVVVPDGYSLDGMSPSEIKTAPRIAVFSKVADGSEKSVDVSWDTEGAWAAQVFEFDTDECVRDAAKASKGASAIDALSIALQALSDDAEGFGFALFASSTQGEEPPTYSGSFAHYSSLATEDKSLVLDLAVADDHLRSAGKYQCEATWESKANRAALLLALDIAKSNGETPADEKFEERFDVTRPDDGTVLWYDGPVGGPSNGTQLIGLTRGQMKKRVAEQAHLEPVAAKVVK
jgi:hypothetical protein